MKKFWSLLLIFAAACATPDIAPGGAPFALLGDMPYSQAEANYLDGMIEAMNREPLAFVVHVGDITSGGGPCSDAWLEARRRQFARLRAPFILLPGDNDWTDCHRTGFDPLERLAKWRSLFCTAATGLRMERQGGEYCEHARWLHEGILFVGLNVPGSNNNLGRTPVMDIEYEQRMRAVFDWIDSSIALAARGQVHAVVLLMQADPLFEPARRGSSMDGYAPLRARLATHALKLKNRIVVVHGDSHEFRDDRPLPGLRRIEVHGSPFLRWLRVSSPKETARQDFLTVEIAN